MRPNGRTSIIKTLKNELPYLQEQFGVEQIALFGSFAHGEEHERSDVDILVSLSKPLGFSFIQLADYLEEKLGRKVDLITVTTLELGNADPRRAHIVKEIEDSLVYV